MAKKKAASSTGSSQEDITRRSTDPQPGTKAMSIVVTLSDDALSKAKQIGQKLKKSGMTIETELESIGQFIGSSSQADIERLNAIEGVSAVEELGEVQLPPIRWIPSSTRAADAIPVRFDHRFVPMVSSSSFVMPARSVLKKF